MKTWLCAIGLVLGIPIPLASVCAQTIESGCGIFREIDDPATGTRWLLECDAQHPGGPGWLVPISGRMAAGGSGTRFPVIPVIRAGDRVVLEAHTAVMDARLEGIAMMPAAKGSIFNVRLNAGGGVLRAVALGPGRGEWLPEPGGRP